MRMEGTGNSLSKDQLSKQPSITGTFFLSFGIWIIPFFSLSWIIMKKSLHAVCLSRDSIVGLKQFNHI